MNKEFNKKLENIQKEFSKSLTDSCSEIQNVKMKFSKISENLEEIQKNQYTFSSFNYLLPKVEKIEVLLS